MKKKSKTKKENNKNNKYLNFLFYIVIIAIVALGIWARIKGYLTNPSLWHDECALAWNIKQKSYLELFKNLRFSQVAPPMFLISVKAVVDIFNMKTNPVMTDLAMVTIPFVAGILSIFVFYFISKDVFKKRISQIVAMLLFSINLSLINYSLQIKQYSTDVLFVLLTILLFLKIDTEKLSKKALITYSVFAAVSIWFSFVTIFLWAAGFLVLLFKRKGLKNVGYLFLPLFVSCFLYAEIYLFGTYSLNGSGMVGYWQNGFVEKNLSNFIPIFVQNIQFFFTSQIYFAYAEIILMLIGLLTFIYDEKKDFAFISLLSIAFVITASVFKIYPFSTRLILFLIPIFIVFTAKALDLFGEKQKILSAFLILLVIAITIPQGFLFKNFMTFKTYNKGEFPREMMQIMSKNIKPKDKIFITEPSNCEYFYYSSFYNLKNKLIYAQYKNDSNKNLSAVKKLSSGKYWIYLPYDYSLNKETNRDIVLYLKNNNKILKYYQKGQSVLAYIKK